MKKLSGAIYSVVTPDHIPAAISMIDSFQIFHPEFSAFLVVNHPHPIKWQHPGITVINSMDIAICDAQAFFFKYSASEACEAIRPFAARHLFQRYGIQKLIYSDADVLFYSRVTELLRELHTHPFVVTPHTIDPYPPDGARPNEYDCLLTGQYNGGLIGMKRSAYTYAVLQWWGTKTYDGAYHQMDAGLYADQKWLDCVPILFPRTHILRHRAYNVAYWNLHGVIPHMRIYGSRIVIDKEPLRSFHFSGLDPNNPTTLSAHQNRYKLQKLSRTIKTYIKNYISRIVQYEQRLPNLPKYGYGYFTNGTLISQQDRNIYRYHRMVKKPPEQLFHQPSFSRWVTSCEITLRINKLVLIGKSLTRLLW